MGSLGNGNILARWQTGTRWSNHVSDDPLVGAPWGYLLVFERDVAAAKGSWKGVEEDPCEHWR